MPGLRLLLSQETAPQGGGRGGGQGGRGEGEGGRGGGEGGFWCSPHRQPKSIEGGETSPPDVGAHLWVHTEGPPPPPTRWNEISTEYPRTAWNER